MSSVRRTTYQVTRYDDAEQVLRDGETFSSTINARAHRAVHGRPHPRDGRRRTPRSTATSSPRRSARRSSSVGTTTLVRPMINRLLDAIAPIGRADLVVDVTSKYPVQVICGIVGVPLEDAPQFHQWAEQINTGPLAPGRRDAASQAMVDYLRPLVEARGARTRPATSSPTSCMPKSTASSSPTSKIYGFLRLLLPAGRRDDVPRHGELPRRAAHASRRARRGRRRSCPASPR